MIIDCHIHAGLIGDHYPKWWIDELHRHWGGIGSRNYSRRDMTVGERLLHQMNELGLDMMCLMTSDHRRVYPHAKGPDTPNDFLLEVQSVAPERVALTCSVDPLRDSYESVRETERRIQLASAPARSIPPTTTSTLATSGCSRLTRSWSSSTRPCRCTWAGRRASMRR